MKFGSIDDLFARIGFALSDDSGRPLALLCGSGISTPAVPPVNKIIKSIRDGLNPDEQVDLDVRLQAIGNDGERYQEAFNFLSFRRPPSFRDRVIALSTLHAYKAPAAERANTSEEALARYESNLDRWDLPRGVEALGRIWAGLPDRVRGPIVTTNFDPLCEVAIRKAGKVATPQILNDDNTFIRNLNAIEEPVVLHLHGYWKDTNTLNMNDQLSQERPALAGSIKELLRKFTFVVVGYSGWIDIFSKQIAAMIIEQRASELDILWCAYPPGDQFEALNRGNQLFTQMQKAPGNVVFYQDIDSNIFFPGLEKHISDHLIHSDSARMGSGRGNLIGWSSVRAEETQNNSDVSDEDRALSFFDGRMPTWKDASNRLIPRRDIVLGVTNYVSESMRKRLATLTTIVGPAGEGKSTVLKQVALETVRAHDGAQLLYQHDSHYGGPKEIISLPVGRPYVLIIDDAYGYIDQLRNIVTALHDSGRSDIHIIAACRDSDWRVSGAANFAWSKFITYRTFPLKGMSRPDAAAIVQSWEKIGSRALGQLADERGTETRITRLVTAASDHRFALEGAFLGALLVTRLGSNLENHIREMLVRASHVTVGDSVGGVSKTLLDVLALIALPQSQGVHELTFPVLADAAGISLPELYADVLPSLGEEAAVSFSDERISIRHGLIAQAIYGLSPEFNINLHEVAADLVESAIHSAANAAFSPALGRLMYLSSHLNDPELAVSAARAAVQANPRRLSFRTSLSAALRRAGKPAEAAEVCESSLAILRTADDRYSSRPLFTEWGVAEGNLENWARNAVLAGVALEDNELLGVLQAEKVANAFACLTLAFKKLLLKTDQKEYLGALAAAVAWAEPSMTDSRHQKWLNEAEEVVLAHGSRIPSINEMSRRELFEGLRSARGSLESPLPALMPLQDFKFSQLERIAGL